MTEAVRRTRKAQTTLAGVSILGALGAATAIGVTTHTASSSSPADNGGQSRAQRLSQGGYRGDDGRGDDGGRDDGRLLSAPRQGSGQVQQAPQAPLPAPHAQSSGS